MSCKFTYKFHWGNRTTLLHAVLPYIVQVLNVSPDTSDNLFQVLSAILWIGNLEFEDTDSEACRLTQTDRETVRKIALLLGLEEAQVMKVCTTRQITVKGTTTDIALKYHQVHQLISNLSFCACFFTIVMSLHKDLVHE